MGKLNGWMVQTFLRSASFLHVVSENHRLSRVISTPVPFVVSVVKLKGWWHGLDCSTHRVFSSCGFSESSIKQSRIHILIVVD